MELHGTFPWNSMENVDAGISMEIVVLMFSMEFHGKCPNPPWKSMEKFPWNSMEIDVLILHGIPWRFFTRDILLHKKHWSLFGAFSQKNTKTYYNRPGASWSKLDGQRYPLDKLLSKR